MRGLGLPNEQRYINAEQRQLRRHRPTGGLAAKDEIWPRQQLATRLRWNNSTKIALVLVAMAAYFGTAYWLEVTYPVPRRLDAEPNVAGKKTRLYGPFSHPVENPFSYAIEGPFLLGRVTHPSGDSTGSALQLYENHTRLGPADSTLKDIAFVGLGRFFHWEEKGTLIFSTSDNSNPNANGRAYWIVKP